MIRIIPVLAAAAVWLLLPLPAFAHCDALDGPVVKAAMAALQKGDVTPVLKWVASDQEAELRGAFEEARAVRAGGARAQALADRYFFETVVRLHRQSEGEPYTGVKPAGHIAQDLVEADRAMASGTSEHLVHALIAKTTKELQAKFAAARERRARADESVDAGRRYVAAYVAFMHYVEQLAAVGAAGEHGGHK